MLGYYTGNRDLVDLAKKCLKFIPDHRLTFAQILEHPYLREHHDVSKEPTTNKKIMIDSRKNTMLALRKEIYKIADEMNKEREN